MLKLNENRNDLWLFRFFFVTLHLEVQNGLGNNLKQ